MNMRTGLKIWMAVAVLAIVALCGSAWAVEVTGAAGGGGTSPNVSTHIVGVQSSNNEGTINGSDAISGHGGAVCDVAGVVSSKTPDTNETSLQPKIVGSLGSDPTLSSQVSALSSQSQSYTPPFASCDGDHGTFEIDSFGIGIKGGKSQYDPDGLWDCQTSTLYHGASAWSSVYSHYGLLVDDHISATFTVPENGRYTLEIRGRISGKVVSVCHHLGIGVEWARYWIDMDSHIYTDSGDGVSFFSGRTFSLSGEDVAADFEGGPFTIASEEGYSLFEALGQVGWETAWTYLTSDFKDIAGLLNFLTLIEQVDPVEQWPDDEFIFTESTYLKAGQTYRWFVDISSQVWSQSPGSIGGNFIGVDMVVKCDEVTITREAITISSLSLSPSTVDPYESFEVSGYAEYDTGDPVDSATATISVQDGFEYTTPVSGGYFSRYVQAPGNNSDSDISRTVTVTVDDGYVEPPGTASRTLTVRGQGSGSGFTFNDALMCRDAQDNDPWGPIDVIDVFGDRDTQITCWIELLNVNSSSHVVKWKWYQPDGTLRETSTWTIPGGPWSSYRTWWTWSIPSDNWWHDLEGEWRVKIYVDDVYQKSVKYTMRYALTQHLMCKDYQTQDPWMYVDPTNTFYQTDEKVVAWCQLENVPQPLELKWKAYEPAGSLYSEWTGDVDDPTSSGYDYWTTWRHSGYFHVNGYAAAQKCGDWYVEVFIKDIYGNWDLEYTDYFQILEDPAVQPTVSVSASPPAPIENEFVTVSVSANDNTYLKNVVFYWKVDGSQSEQLMADNIYSSSYSGSHAIGAFSAGQHVEYWAVACDTTGNVRESSHRTFIIPPPYTGPYYVDDNALNDPGPGDTSLSDPLEDGTPDHPFDAIQEAIEAAYEGDVVIVLEGTYTGTGNRDIDFGGKAITVRSRNGAETCIIDCNGTEAEPHRGFYIHSGEDANTIIDGFTIANGYGPIEEFAGGYVSSGGAIQCISSDATVKNCVIHDCIAEVGGAIATWQSNVKASNCNIRNNTARGIGGGIFCYEGSHSIRNCMIVNNNSGEELGDGEGGGLHFYLSTLTVINSVVALNSAGKYGGGIYCYESSLDLVNSTVSGNIVQNYGGGIVIHKASTARIMNSILWDNSASNGPELSISNYWYPSTVTISYCDVAGGRSTIYVEENCTLNWGANIDNDPCFADPCNGDYHILPGSPCIDAGDPFYPDDANEFDIDGDARIIGGRIDIGADEYAYGELSDFNGDGIVNFKDFSILAYYWMDYLCSEPDWCEGSDFDESDYVDFGDLKTFAENWLWQAIWYSQ